MNLLATRDPNGGRQNGSAGPSEWVSVTATQSLGWMPNSQAKRPYIAGTQSETRQASGFLTLFNLNQKQSTHCMTPEPPVLPSRFERLESPQNSIEASISSPREPEIQQEPCPIRPIARGDQNPGEAPVTATAPATATAIATVTAIATDPAKEAQEEARNPEAGDLAVAGHAEDQNAFL